MELFTYGTMVIAPISRIKYWFGDVPTAAIVVHLEVQCEKPRNWFIDTIGM